MAKVGAQRAAELTGRSKSTIQRAMNGGKLSYEVDNNGRRVIDVAELERAFGLVPQGTERAVQDNVEAELEKATQMIEIERLKMRVRMLEEQLDAAKDLIEDIKEQRDQWQKQAQQVLLTSQYSQKQAEELKAELKEREQRAKIRRQQELERRAQTQQQAGRPSQKAQADGKASAFADIQGLWRTLRGQQDATVANNSEKTQDNAAPAATETAATDENSDSSRAVA